MPSEPQHAASQLYAVQVVSSALKAPPKNQEGIQMQAEGIEGALVGFPEFRPAHRLAAKLYMELNDYTRAEKHYLEEANATEKSAEPLAALASYALFKHDQGEDKDD